MNPMLEARARRFSSPGLHGATITQPPNPYPNGIQLTDGTNHFTWPVTWNYDWGTYVALSQDPRSSGMYPIAKGEDWWRIVATMMYDARIAGQVYTDYSSAPQDMPTPGDFIGSAYVIDPHLTGSAKIYATASGLGTWAMLPDAINFASVDPATGIGSVFQVSGDLPLGVVGCSNINATRRICGATIAYPTAGGEQRARYAQPDANGYYVPIVIEGQAAGMGFGDWFSQYVMEPITYAAIGAALTAGVAAGAGLIGGEAGAGAAVTAGDVTATAATDVAATGAVDVSTVAPEIASFTVPELPAASIPEIANPAIDIASASTTAASAATSSSGVFSIANYVKQLAGLYSTVKSITGAAVTHPQAGTVTRLPDGSQQTIQPNGAVIIVQPNGQQTTINPGGQVTASAPSDFQILSLAIGALSLLMRQ